MWITTTTGRNYHDKKVESWCINSTAFKDKTNGKYPVWITTTAGSHFSGTHGIEIPGLIAREKEMGTSGLAEKCPQTVYLYLNPKYNEK